MASTSAYTGRVRRRRTTWKIRAGDVLARVLITCVGISTIAAVLLVFLFLGWMVLPLFLPGKMDQVADGKSAWREQAPWQLGIDDHQMLAWGLLPDGKLQTIQLGQDHLGDVLGQRDLLTGAVPTCVSRSADGAELTVGCQDGTFRLCAVGFRTTFLDAGQVPRAVRGMRAGETRALRAGVVQKTPSDQFRLQELSLDVSLPLESGGSAPIVLLDHSRLNNGTVACTLSQDGALTLQILRPAAGLDADPGAFQVTQVPLPLTLRKEDPRALRLLISGMGDTAFLAFADGRLVFFDLRDRKQPRVAGEVDLVPEPGETLRALEFMLGKTTLVAGDSLGRIRGWFLLRAEEENEQAPARSELVMAHEFPPASSAVTRIVCSQRKRLFAAGFADGSVHLLHMTTEQTLQRVRGRAVSVDALTLSPKDDGLLVAGRDALSQWRIDEPNPEVPPSALVLPVWYEGYAKPSFVWQSMGSDAFEPKFGFMPLVFGTLKATFYSLLFGVPLAILAAIYTSEFLHARQKARIKPTIELMASLPSVVLGYLGALSIAPFVSDHLSALLGALACIPFGLLLIAHLWQLLPSTIRQSLAPWRFGLMSAAFLLSLAAGVWVGPLFERWLFAGDVKTWLDGQAGGAAGGWTLILLPLAIALVFLFIGTQFNPRLRDRMSHAKRSTAAIVELVKFLTAALLALGLALVSALALQALGLDPRGSIVGTYVQRNALVVGAVMGFAIVPIIYTIAEDALSSVPEHLRAASLGAGATPWQTAIRVVIPTCMSGLFSAVMVGLGRAVGETMIVLMAAGNTPIMDVNIFNGFRTLSANIAVEMPEAARGSTHFRTLFLAGLVLFALTFCLNTAAEFVRQRYRRKAAQL